MSYIIILAISTMIYVFAIVIINIIVGFYKRNHVDGHLYIYEKNEEGLTCGVNFEKGAEELENKDYIVLKVHTRK